MKSEKPSKDEESEEEPEKEAEDSESEDEEPIVSQGILEISTVLCKANLNVAQESPSQKRKKKRKQVGNDMLTIQKKQKSDGEDKSVTKVTS